MTEELDLNNEGNVTEVAAVIAKENKADIAGNKFYKLRLIN